MRLLMPVVMWSGFDMFVISILKVNLKTHYKTSALISEHL
jgi:hypothetical protein